MDRLNQDTTASALVAAYEAIVAMGATGELAADAARMRQIFQERTGAFHPEDPWFEVRTAAFWDDALTAQGFAALSREELPEHARGFVRCLERAHRGFFVVDEVWDHGARLDDLWSGAELIVRTLDETQALVFDHSEGGLDARVVACPGTNTLYVLPGAYHHPPEALEPAMAVLGAARERGMETTATLDALLRMELVLRTSSRVKAAFAYRVESLPRA